MDPLSKRPHQLGLVTLSARELEALVVVHFSTNALTLFHFVLCADEHSV